MSVVDQLLHLNVQYKIKLWVACHMTIQVRRRSETRIDKTKDLKKQNNEIDQDFTQGSVEGLFSKPWYDPSYLCTFSCRNWIYSITYKKELLIQHTVLMINSVLNHTWLQVPPARMMLYLSSGHCEGWSLLTSEIWLRSSKGNSSIFIDNHVIRLFINPAT